MTSPEVNHFYGWSPDFGGWGTKTANSALDEAEKAGVFTDGFCSAVIRPRFNVKTRQWLKDTREFSVHIRVSEEYVFKEPKEFPYQINIFRVKGYKPFDL